MLQDVLDQQGDGLEIKKHIIDRINKQKEQHQDPITFFAHFFQRDEKKQIDAVLQKVANEMSRTIFGSWNQILGKNATGKRVQIDWLLDGDKGNSPYLELSIVDGQSKYNLSERSLGFRWFFSFLLFTQFRKNRKDNGPTIFLFDEPAANLHSRAQIKLLESFSRIAIGTNYIVYSTHSHYMVNPLWLEKAYIIENKANNYDSDEDIESFIPTKTDIHAIKYRTFVGTNDTKTTYFQPVLDALDVTFSPLIRDSRALIVEGKFDYFPIVYLHRALQPKSAVGLFPCNGAGSMANLISLFRGWSVDFKILLDDDPAGRSARDRYISECLLLSDQVVTIGDINADFKGMKFESVYKNDVRELIKSRFSLDKLDKKHFSLFFQELLATSQNAEIKDTLEGVKPLSDWIAQSFD